jgi:hypothetical protein
MSLRAIASDLEEECDLGVLSLRNRESGLNTGIEH